MNSDFIKKDGIDCGPSGWSRSRVGGCTNSNSTVWATQGVVFCNSCRAEQRASKLLSGIMIRAAMQNLTLGDAFGTAMMHMYASTYCIHLPYMNAVEPAVYTLLRPITLITEPFWLYPAVAYTFFLVVLALLVRVKMLAVVGIDSTGSLMANPAMVQGDALQPLLDRGHMMSPDNILDEAEKMVSEDKAQKLKLSVTATGRYGMGFDDEVKKLDWRTARFGYENIKSADSSESQV